MSVLLAGVMPKLFAALGILMALGAAYLGIRRSGVKAQQAADTQKTLKEVENAQAARSTVAAMSDAAAADKLRTDWTR
jgi:uncharacterized membrane protein YphA (DoxX/SURF4 family)